jgi:hypothetical protein
MRWTSIALASIALIASRAEAGGARVLCQDPAFALEVPEGFVERPAGPILYRFEEAEAPAEPAPAPAPTPDARTRCISVTFESLADLIGETPPSVGEAESELRRVFPDVEVSAAAGLGAWRGVEVDRYAYAVRSTTAARPTVLYIARVPTTPRAVQIVAGGPSVREAAVRATLIAFLHGLDARVQFLEEARRTRALGLALAAAGLTVLAVAAASVSRARARARSTSAPPRRS